MEAIVCIANLGIECNREGLVEYVVILVQRNSLCNVGILFECSTQIFCSDLLAPVTVTNVSSRRTLFVLPVILLQPLWLPSAKNVLKYKTVTERSTPPKGLNT